MSDTSPLARQTGVAILSLLIAACGGGKAPSSPPPAPSSPAVAVAPDLESRLAGMERQGVLPELDRSTDIAGPDRDANGIRDDIDAWIAALPVSDPVRKAARQVARVQQQSLLIDLKDRAGLMRHADAEAASSACMASTMLRDAIPDRVSQALREGHAITFKIEAITANTPERAERYLAYMGALHGKTTTYPTGKVCEDE